MEPMTTAIAEKDDDTRILSAIEDVKGALANIANVTLDLSQRLRVLEGKAIVANTKADEEVIPRIAVEHAKTLAAFSYIFQRDIIDYVLAPGFKKECEAFPRSMYSLVALLSSPSDPAATPSQSTVAIRQQFGKARLGLVHAAYQRYAANFKVHADVLSAMQASCKGLWDKAMVQAVRANEVAIYRVTSYRKTIIEACEYYHISDELLKVTQDMIDILQKVQSTGYCDRLLAL